MWKQVHLYNESKRRASQKDKNNHSILTEELPVFEFLLRDRFLFFLNEMPPVTNRLRCYHGNGAFEVVRLSSNSCSASFKWTIVDP